MNRDNYVVASQESAVPYLSLTFIFTTKAGLKIIIAATMIEKSQPCVRSLFPLVVSIDPCTVIVTDDEPKGSTFYLLIPYSFIFNMFSLATFKLIATKRTSNQKVVQRNSAIDR